MTAPIKKKIFKQQLINLLEQDIEEMDYEQKIRLVHDILLKYEIDNEKSRDTSNKGKPWTDEQLTIILSDAFTKENCMKYAKLFGRGYGSIEQIHRWARTPIDKVNETRKDDSFVQQVKRIAKEIGLSI
ncbi:MAG: hypothetical protein E7C94_06060 [Finegoldia magna]|uniref:hypothetical protein n=1 Tax=Finegoldia magna TaxID=1260 RepID=UPI0029014407|nr:hypothetical protein [Finegoldia magna]MDU1832514.1 hypothetical protein [Finegoldia magna]MDU2575481.1 hypothetical protein [Finegoldia magna]